MANLLDPEYDNRHLNDGIYEVDEDVEVLVLNDRIDDLGEKDRAKAAKFIKRHPNFRIGSAYETYATILVAEPPTKFKGQVKGTGFNYGSTNILAGLHPGKMLLILAEND